MYCPPAFRQHDTAELQHQMRASGLATLVSHGAAGLQASHLPLLLAADEGEFGTLYGHFARANPHWRALADDGEALAIFGGPQAYVSPSWYPGKAEHGRAVPTWNYIAVHARGPVELFDDPLRLRRLLGRLSDRHEAGREQPWSLDEAPHDYIEAQLRAIVGFALPIRTLHGQWKLSQNRTAADRAGVQRTLAASADSCERELAARMPATD